MKISNLLETATPSSMPDPNTAAPKFGRSDEMLESDIGTSTAGGIASVSKPMGKMQKRGQGSMFKGISTSSKYANSAKAGISEDSVNEDELSEEQLQAKQRREENFKKAKDRELGNKPQSREIMAKEEFNGEYDDEAGMFKNNLQTIQRVSTHLEKAISDNENLPEWCQEKIGVAKSMVVTVMDYMISQHENGEQRTVDEAGPGVPFRGVGGAFNRGDDERHDLDTPKQQPPQIWGLKINGKIWSKNGKYVTFTSREAALKSRDSILKTRPDLEIGLVTQGGTAGAPVAPTKPTPQKPLMAVSLDYWRKAVLARYPEARFATQKMINGATIATDRTGQVGIYDPKNNYSKVGPETQGVSEGYKKHHFIYEGIWDHIKNVFKAKPKYVRPTRNTGESESDFQRRVDDAYNEYKRAIGEPTEQPSHAQKPEPIGSDQMGHGSEDNELKMFMAGQKPAAIISPAQLSKWQKLIDSGKYAIAQLMHQGRPAGVIIAQPGEEHRVEKIQSLVQNATDAAEKGDFRAYQNSNYHRWLGKLLGYSEDKINSFIQNYFKDTPDLAKKPVHEDMTEVAPPGAKAERMVKHIKKSYAKDGELSDKEREIAYATAWKAHKAGKVEEEGKGLWANIHAKRERIKHGSGEKMRQPGSKGAPTASALKRSAK